MLGATQPKKSHNDYSVGWVCALPKEQTAAKAMLDDEHETLQKPSNDPNSYTLGSVGKHNIVIACLPAGQIGTNSAATVAMWMISTFPRIKFGLMVGIGGGVPIKVRLGDAVISRPGDGFPGVVQWDMGKATDGGRFQRTGALNNPPTSLLTAITKLQSNHEMAGPKVPEYLDTMRRKWPRLAKKYLKSDSLKDVRFRADYKHVNGSFPDDEDEDDEEDSCRFCDKTKTVRRKAREEDVEVHYGLIASGNQVIKDATFRDKLNKDLGGEVLCVEMEAAGLMNNFPCIVIRGICDYSDSHKNKAWQEYAAAVAAALAKELLQYVMPDDVERERTIKEMLGQVLEKMIEVEDNMGQMKYAMDEEYDHKVLNWLSPFDYSLQQNEHIKKHQAGTGKWLLESAKFRAWADSTRQTLPCPGMPGAWVDTTRQTLFCPGMPGAGKTILTARVVDTLVSRFSDDRSVGIAYVYFNFWRQDESKVEELFANILKQLAQRPSSLPKHVRDLYDRHTKNRTRPSLHEITKCVKSVIKEFSRVFIIADALDECATDNHCRAKFMEELFKLPSYGANVFATSRFIPEVTDKFDKNSWLEIRAADDDVRAYVAAQIAQSESDILKEMREKAIAGIADAADGMFLLAKLDLESLFDERLPKDVEAALKNLPRGSNAYDQAYESAMKRVLRKPNSGSSRLAKAVLLWIACAKRQLGLAELQHALAIDPGDSGLKLEYLPPQKDLASVCAGLVIVDEASDIICLFHRTAQEYLEGAREQWFPHADDDISKICVTYLSFDVFKSGPCLTGPDLAKQLETYRLYDYAARYWGHHARSALILDPLVTAFLRGEAEVEASSQVLLDPARSESREQQQNHNAPMHTTGLHLAAYFGIERAVRVLLSRYGRDPKDGYSRTPLSWAAQNGHEVVVRLLLAEGADRTMKDSSRFTPLLWARQGNHEAIVRLLEGGVNGEWGVPDKPSSLPLTAEATGPWDTKSGQDTTRRTHEPPISSPSTAEAPRPRGSGSGQKPVRQTHRPPTTDACTDGIGDTRQPPHQASPPFTAGLGNVASTDGASIECFQGLKPPSQAHESDDCLRDFSYTWKVPASGPHDSHCIDGFIDARPPREAMHPCIAGIGLVATTTTGASECLQSLLQPSRVHNSGDCLMAFSRSSGSAASELRDCLTSLTQEPRPTALRDCTLWF